MSQVRKSYKYKGAIIRHVFKDGRWCYDTTHSLILWDTLKEAKESVSDSIGWLEAARKRVEIGSKKNRNGIH